MCEKGTEIDREERKKQKRGREKESNSKEFNERKKSENVNERERKTNRLITRVRNNERAKGDIV